MTERKPEAHQQRRLDHFTRFDTRKRAWDYLNANGYKVSVGKFYQDCGAGFPRVFHDKSVSYQDVLEYGRGLTWSSFPPPDVLRLPVQKITIGLSSEWNENKQARLLLAIRVGIREGLDQGVSTIIKAAEGNPEKDNAVRLALTEILETAYKNTCHSLIQSLEKDQMRLEKKGNAETTAPDDQPKDREGIEI